MGSSTSYLSNVSAEISCIFRTLSLPSYSTVPSCGGDGAPPQKAAAPQSKAAIATSRPQPPNAPSMQRRSLPTQPSSPFGTTPQYTDERASGVQLQEHGRIPIRGHFVLESHDPWKADEFCTKFLKVCFDLNIIRVTVGQSTLLLCEVSVMILSAADGASTPPSGSTAFEPQCYLDAAAIEERPSAPYLSVLQVYLVYTKRIRSNFIAKYDFTHKRSLSWG